MSLSLPKAGCTLVKMAVGAALLFGLGAATMAYAQTQPMNTVEKVELDRYLGVWYEVARKPLSFQNKCDRDVSAVYTLNEKGHVTVDNRCYGKAGELHQSVGEAFIQDPPKNSKLKVSFLPEIIRWLPVGRGDYWILKIDKDYETVLVGEPKRKYLWVLSRSKQPDPAVLQEYLDHAKSVGYDLSDLIHTKQTVQPQ